MATPENGEAWGRARRSGRGAGAWLGVGLAVCAGACGAQPAPSPAPPTAASQASAPPPVAASTAGTSVTPPETVAALRGAVAAGHRSDKERARDAWLHPVETLAFFGLRDDMTVVELSPDKGQWTAVLAPVLLARGKLRIANGDRFSEWPKSNEILAERIAKNEASFGGVETVRTNWAKCGLTLGPDGSADMVLTFRNLHDWLGAEVADKVLTAVHAVLEPGGTFGVVDHRGKPGAPTEPKDLGDEGGAYVPQAFMIETIERYGFTLVGSSEINANPNDTKDWPKGALTLPPQLAMGEQDRAKYLAVGESDCMTLRFVRR